MSLRPAAAFVFLALGLGFGLAACPKEQPPAQAAKAEEPPVELPTAIETPEGSAKKRANVAFITLNGERTQVRWSDGDSFKFLEGTYEGSGVRLTGYNTLESYGPVHRWGDWTAQELFDIARTSKYQAASQEWTCTTDGERDGYNRVLVSCPEAAMYMVGVGHAHVFGFDEGVAPRLLRVQKEAMKQGVGMWAKGTPTFLITSLHSADEEYAQQQGSAYNRVAHTGTGESHKREHGDNYGICEEICLPEGPEKGSCMTYVPFERRYRNKAECLRRPRSDGSKNAPREKGE